MSCRAYLNKQKLYIVAVYMGAYLHIFFCHTNSYVYRWRHAVALLAEALRYKPKGHGYVPWEVKAAGA